MDRFYEYLLLERRPFDRRWLTLLGILAPFLAAFYSISIAATGMVRFSTGRAFARQTIELRGFDALLYMVCVLSAGAAIHCYCSWEGSVHPLAKLIPPVLLASVAIFVVAIFWLLVRQCSAFV